MNIPTDPLYTEKSGKQSKKFLAAMRFTRDWTIVLVLTLGVMVIAAYLVPGEPPLVTGLGPVLIAEIVVLGFVQVLYLGGQAAVDTFVRMAVVIVTGRNGTKPSDQPNIQETDPEE